MSTVPDIWYTESAPVNTNPTFIRIDIAEDGTVVSTTDATAEITEVIRARNETGQYLAAVIADNGGSIELPTTFDYRPDRTVIFGTLAGSTDETFAVYTAQVIVPADGPESGTVG